MTIVPSLPYERVLRALQRDGWVLFFAMARPAAIQSASCASKGTRSGSAAPPVGTPIRRAEPFEAVPLDLSLLWLPELPAP